MHNSFFLSIVSSVFLLLAFLFTHTVLLQRLWSTVSKIFVGWNCQVFYVLWNLALLVWSGALFSWISIGIAVIDDENHQKLVVGYCADIFTLPYERPKLHLNNYQIFICMVKLCNGANGCALCCISFLGKSYRHQFFTCPWFGTNFLSNMEQPWSYRVSK